MKTAKRIAAVAMAAGCLAAGMAGDAGAVVLASWSDPDGDGSLTSPAGGLPSSSDPALAVTGLQDGATPIVLTYWSNGWASPTRYLNFDLTVPAGKELLVTDWSATVRCDNGAMAASLTTVGAGAYSLGSTSSVAGGWGEFRFTTIDTTPDVTLPVGTYTFRLNLLDPDNGWWAAPRTFAVNGLLVNVPEPSPLVLVNVGAFGLLMRRRRQ